MQENTRYRCVYHKGKWVRVPLSYVPENAINSETEIQQHIFVSADTGEPIDVGERPKRCSKRARDKILDAAKEVLNVEGLSEKALRAFAVKHEIPLEWLTNRFSSEPKIRKNLSVKRRTIRKYTSLKPREFKKFLKELKRICPLTAIFAEILQFFNQQLSGADCYISGEELLRLKIDDVDPEEGITTNISLSRKTPCGTQMFSHWLPGGVWGALCAAIKPDNLYIFSNARGCPMSIDAINRKFKLAAKNAGIKYPVTTLSLRVEPRKVKKTLDRGVYASFSEESFREISEEEWVVICQKIPGIIKKQGRPSKHDKRAVFNAILFHFRTKTPLRKLPSYFPDYQSVHFHYARWKKNGIFDAVLNLR